MRGRKPKPTYLRVLDGNAGHRKANPDEPQVKAPLEECGAPDHLTARQRRIWDEAMRNAPPGLLRALDFSAFERWVTHRDKFLEAKEKVDAFGLIIKGKDGTPRDNPWKFDMNKQSLLCTKIEAELGFTPSSRTRVKVDPKAPGAASPFAGLKSLTDD